MSLLRTMSPAAIDAEIRGLSPDNGGSLEWLQHFLQFLLSQLKTNKDFELVESYLGLFLKVCFYEVMCMHSKIFLRCFFATTDLIVESRTSIL